MPTSRSSVGMLAPPSPPQRAQPAQPALLVAPLSGAAYGFLGTPLCRKPLPGRGTPSMDARVLVTAADDSLAERLRAAMNMGGLAATVEWSDGGRIIEALRAGQFQLVIVDESTPSRSVLEVIHHLRARDRYVPIVLTLRSMQQGGSLQAIEAGATDIVLAPVTTEAAEHLLARFVQSSQLPVVAQSVL